MHSHHAQHIAVLVLCIFATCTSAVPVDTKPSTKQQSEKKPFTFDDIFAGRFYFGGFNGSWISGNNFFCVYNFWFAYRFSVIFTDDEFLYRRGDLNRYRVNDSNVEVFLESNVYVSFMSANSI